MINAGLKQLFGLSSDDQTFNNHWGGGVGVGTFPKLCQDLFIYYFAVLQTAFQAACPQGMHSIASPKSGSSA